MVSLLDLIQESLPVSIRRNGEVHGPCPFCGEGQDRFIIWPEKDRAWCRQCGWKGDSIQFLRDYYGLSFREAKQRLDLDTFTGPAQIQRRQHERQTIDTLRKEFAEWERRQCEVATTIYRTRSNAIAAWERFLVRIRHVSPASHDLWQRRLCKLYESIGELEAEVDFFTYDRHERERLARWDEEACHAAR